MSFIRSIVKFLRSRFAKLAYMKSQKVLGLSEALNSSRPVVSMCIAQLQVTKCLLPRAPVAMCLMPSASAFCAKCPVTQCQEFNVAFFLFFLSRTYLSQRLSTQPNKPPPSFLPTDMFLASWVFRFHLQIQSQTKHVCFPFNSGSYLFCDGLPGNIGPKVILSQSS